MSRHDRPSPKFATALRRCRRTSTSVNDVCLPATEAAAAGYGGIAAVSAATGIAVSEHDRTRPERPKQTPSA